MTASSIANPALPIERGTRASELWQWWTGELRSLVPARVTGWVVGEVAITDVMVDSAGIRLMRTVAGKQTISTIVPASELSTSPVLRELRAKGNDRVRVLLAAEQVLLKAITLPAAIEENLRQVMGFELDRHTPFMANQAYYDVKVARRDAQRESIDVQLAVASKAEVDPLLVLLRQAGFSVESIAVVDAEAAGQAYELLPATDKPARKWGNLLKLNLAMLALVAALGLLALLLPIWQKREQVIALNPLVGKSNADYEVSQRVHDEYTKLAGEYNYITGKKQSMHPSLAIIEELTKISPDTTSVQSLDIKTNGKVREVTLIGEAQAASRVIEVLEQSPLFQNASQRSQTRRGSLGTNEWFHIATELKPRVLPAAIRPDEIAAAASEKTVNVPAAIPATPLTSNASPGGAESSTKGAPATAPIDAGLPTKLEPPAAGAPATSTSKGTSPTATVTTVSPAVKVAPEAAPSAPAPANRKQP